MLGGGFYSHNSRPQRAAATAADAHLAAAAAGAAARPPDPGARRRLRLRGRRERDGPARRAVDGLRARDATLPIEVAHTDLPQNDFGPLFALLQGPRAT